VPECDRDVSKMRRPSAHWGLLRQVGWGGRSIEEKIIIFCPDCTEVGPILDTVLNSTCKLLGLWDNAKEKSCYSIKQDNKRNARYKNTDKKR
jgi:hypothetical protein